MWLHGVRPLSDAPGTAAFLFAAAFLVRCGRMGRGRDLVLGALFTAIAAGVRPQVGLALLPLAAWGALSVYRRREIRALFAAVAVGLGVSAILWIPAITGSGGWASWLNRFRMQMRFVRAYDSPSTGVLVTLDFWKRWLADAFGDRTLAVAVWIVGASAFLVRPRRAFLLLAVFLPVMFVSIAVLGVHTAPRYALAFLPLPCALLAVVLEAAAERSEVLRAAAAAAGVAVLSWMSLRAVPPVVEVATRTSPPVALMQALRDDPALAGRPVYYESPLEVHVAEYLGGRPASAIPGAVPLNPPSGGLIAAADGNPVGLTPAGRFGFVSPELRLISRARYLETTWYDGREGAAIHVPRVRGAGWWDPSRGLAVLKPGGVLEVYSGSGAVDVKAVARVVNQPASIRIEASGQSVLYSLEPGAHPLSFEGKAGGTSQVSFRIRALSGETVIGDFRLRAPEPGVLLDDSLVASVDDPAPGARVRGAVLIRGWCQEWGGKPVDPVEFRLDGVPIPDLEVRRLPRPDVAQVLPRMGDTSRAGYETTLAAGTISAGRHTLTVVFEEPQGKRRRVYPAREFVVLP